MLGKKNLYYKIKSEINTFDRTFDNTVVDTYAFDKALHSSELLSILYINLYNKHKLSDSEFFALEKEAGSCIIHKVEHIYAKTKHSLKKPAVYYTYLDNLINRIISK